MKEGRCVERLGWGLFVQYGVEALGNGSCEGTAATTARQEGEICGYHALDGEDNAFRAAVTGHSGIGKRWGI